MVWKRQYPMRILLLLLIVGLTHVVLADGRHDKVSLSHAAGNRRQFLFPGLGYPPEPTAAAATQSPEAPATHTAFDPFHIPLEPTSEAKGEHKAKEAGITANLSSTASPGQTITSTAPATSSTAPIQASTSSSAPTSTSSNSGKTRQSDANSSQASSGTSEWKIVCVAVIAFSAVAAILLIAVFFDQCWGFARDVVGRRRTPEGTEEFVPDWEKASWEVRFGDDRHRYPSFASVPSPVVPPPARKNSENPFGIRPLSVSGRDALVLPPSAAASSTTTATYVSPRPPQCPNQSSQQTLVASPRRASSGTTLQRNASTSSRPKSTMPEDVYGGIDV
ncbi:hypothetical protein CERSUDRAFT_99283 [Gelatoporia subvermispora B]|uniref:Transmembrane protein n=1 Tax=Ceriporiopsis subvermispora (strain B) TaxID=914234 RepID=M2PAK9_CERS8|nr:hypothetical protein CERSUDRAFT_99283 [Gelatoporia subvermispora B]